MGKRHKRKKGHSDEELKEKMREEEVENEDDEIEIEIEDEDEEIDDGEDDEGEEIDDEEDEDEEIDDEEDDEDEEIDDEEDDEDDDEDEETDEFDDEEERRAYRRRRRIRNQIISYLIIFIIFVGIAVGAVAVGRKVASIVSQKRQEAELAKALEEAAEQEEGEEELVIDTPETVEEESPEDILGDFAASCYSEMSIEDKVAGLFMVTPEAVTGVATATKAGDGTREALNQYAVGGLIYFGQNIIDREQITEMLANTASMSNYPLFLAVDEEGGDVSRVANSGMEVTKVDDMATIGAGGDPSQAFAAGETIGAYLKEIGFNVDFAPVADVTQEGVESALGNRSFGTDPQIVGEMASNVASGIKESGVSACLKHFPGLGSASDDTHEGRVEISKTMEELRASDFVPFSIGIEAGVDFVMVSHATVPAIDEELPSSLSRKVVTDTLRGELGFEGVVITDALDMTAITDDYTSEQAAVMAIEAGADMLLMPEDFEAAYNAVLAAVQEGTISEERIDESLDRIYRVKCAEMLRGKTDGTEEIR